MRTIKLTLPVDETLMLNELCAADLRSAEQALRWLLRQEATRRGLTVNPEKHNGAASTLAGPNAATVASLPG